MQPNFAYVAQVFPDQEGIEKALNDLDWIRRPNTSRDELFMYKAGNKLPNVVTHVWEHVERMAGTNFNSCCAERYIQPREGFSWRSDSEKSIDFGKPLVIASFGDTREIQMKEYGDFASGEVFTKYLFGGSVMVFPPDFSRYFRYQMKGDINTGPLTTLTFRHVLFS